MSLATLKQRVMVPYVSHVTRKEDSRLDQNSFPGNLAFTHDLHLDFDSPVTFFVGENGSGKSTLLEAMAVLARLPISGGGMNEAGANHAFAERSDLSSALRLAFIKQPKDGQLERIAIEDTSHYQITRGLLNNPEMYWRHLAAPDAQELGDGEP